MNERLHQLEEKDAHQVRYTAVAAEVKRTKIPLGRASRRRQSLAFPMTKEAKLAAQAEDLTRHKNDLDQVRYNTRAEAAALEEYLRAPRARVAPPCADIEDPSIPRGMHRWAWAMDCKALRESPHAEAVLRQLSKHYDDIQGLRGAAASGCTMGMRAHGDHTMDSGRHATLVIGTSPLRVQLSPVQSASPDDEPPAAQGGPMTDAE